MTRHRGGTARFRRPADVAVVDAGTLRGGRTSSPVYLARLDDGPIVVLEGLGALVWRALLDRDEPPGDLAALTGHVAEMAGVPRDDLADAVETFLGELLAGRWIVDGCPGPAPVTSGEDTI